MFDNTYADATRADSYARLDFPGTYQLAFRDLPDLFRRYAPAAARALDFGCGAGRSTRFLRQLGYDVIGADIAPQMLAHARALDPAGRYVLIGDGDLSALRGTAVDLALAAFTFDNIPGVDHRAGILRSLRDLLTPQGIIVLVCSSPAIYVNEWTSFSTRGFEGNTSARSGDTVWIVMKDVEDRRPIQDVLWVDADYRALFANAGLDLLTTHRPLAPAGEPGWVSEQTVSPWVIYVLGRAG